MLRQCLLTYPSSGKAFVCIDGPEVLVYSGNDDGPLWKYFCDDIAVGTAVTKEEVYILDQGGRLLKLRLVNGEYLDADTLEFQPLGLLASHDETLAVIGMERLFVRAPGKDPMEVSISGVTAASFGPDGGSIGLATESGEFHAVDTTTGGAWGSVNLGAPPTGVAWCAQQYWLVSAGDKVYAISGDGATVLETKDIMAPVDAITCSDDGSIVAALVESTQVQVFEWLNKTLAGNIWFQRQVGAIEFGPSSWLAMAHDEGEANRVELFTGQMTRTQAHEGRGQNSWPMQVEMNGSLLRGASTAIKAGNKPLAVQVRSEAIEQKRSSSMVWLIVAIIVLIVICSTISLALCGIGSFLPKGPKYYFGF